MRHAGVSAICIMAPWLAGVALCLDFYRETFTKPDLTISLALGRKTCMAKLSGSGGTVDVMKDSQA